jgi:hypothetical protein
MDINARRFQFRRERNDQEDITKPCGSLGVLDEQTGMTFKAPNDATT